jgi:transketolase C-terminal domain/subunit
LPNLSRVGDSNWNEPREGKLSFTIPGNGVITVESHSCAQIGGAGSASAKVSATHGKVKIKNYKIIK